MSHPGPSIVDLVFEPVHEGKPLPSRAALIVVAVVVHLALMTWAISLEPGLGPWSHALTARIHADLSRVQMIEIPTPPAKQPPPEDVAPAPEPAPPEPTEQVPPPSEPSQKSPAKTPRPARAKPGPPAQASQVVARQPDGPVDMTNNVFVTGSAKNYAGGVSSANGTAKGKGTGTGSGPRQEAGTPKAPDPRPGPDRTMSVHLESSNWECPWPTAAIDAPIDEQLAVIRVTVAKNGSVIAAKVLQDPGHGFGAAALKCAKQTRFEPATNRAGQPIRAQSPPIRVWFSR